MWHGDPATTQRGLGGGWLREIRGVGRGAGDQELAMSAMVPLLCYSPGGFLLVGFLCGICLFLWESRRRRMRFPWLRAKVKY